MQFDLKFVIICQINKIHVGHFNYTTFIVELVGASALLWLNWLSVDMNQ